LDKWNRDFEAYIKDDLGEAIAELQKAEGGRTRVEGSGILLLHAMCQRYPAITRRYVGRAEMSIRQNWCTEVSWNFFNLVTSIITFTVKLCAMDENVLRDAVLVQLENTRFEAYVHVNALMRKIAFAELRALTNRKAVQESGLDMNPMELNELYDCLWESYDCLWNMSVLMQSEKAMDIFKPGKESPSHSPWP
jgi:hypothetical protein